MRKFILISLINMLLMAIVIIACKHEPEELAGPLPPGPEPDPPAHPCDPDTVYFNKDLLPVLISSCGQPGCHDAASMQGDVVLTDYNSVMQTADVRPGDPEGSDIYENIIETDPDKRMPPPPASPLSQENIDMVYTWIVQGAQNLSCDDDCDTLDVSFATHIETIINTHCFGCHNDNNSLGGLSLEGYDKVTAVAGDGRLLGVVRHEAGYSPMPKNADQLPACKIRQIEIWIENGTPQK